MKYRIIIILIAIVVIVVKEEKRCGKVGEQQRTYTDAARATRTER